MSDHNQTEEHTSLTGQLTNNVSPAALSGFTQPAAQLGKTEHSKPRLTSQAAEPGKVERSQEEWITEINRAFGLSTGWIIRAGQLLLRAKKQLTYGQWMSIFESHKVKIGLRKAEMLMAIARHPVLANSQHLSILPQAWGVLYLLSRLPAQVLERGISSGAIHAGLQLSEARALLQNAEAHASVVPGSPAPISFDLARQQARLLCYLRQQATRWPREHREALAALLEALAADLRGEEKTI